ncbi:NUDIX domain-containing protein [Rhizobiales bacterium]|uniref:NUDIX domain-containing protein n=1 Tax=Hongsoonwoonella zoysiae TaxID=2821844 RepID=UPI001561A961|nr:NUDIX domain-containing protein [Hongsoonwoonella zoysiae]NRG17599.1 NUDIX domain-containing protein [Hongsoonwoonella zoysiae]
MQGDDVTSLSSRLLRRVLLTASLMRRAVTLGVRLAVRDDRGRVLLVRHTYLPGWYMPGGGVDLGETAADAGKRELFEEAGLEATAPLDLFALYHNRISGRRDHVALFTVSAFKETQSAFRPNLEIAEAAFFDISDLPENVTPSTLRRLDELSGKSPISDIW